MTFNIPRALRGFYSVVVSDRAITDPSEPVAIAAGNNPLLLSDKQVGKGWRLLTEAEIEQNDDCDTVNRFNPDFQCWSHCRQRWESGFDGNNLGRSYRVKV